MKVSILSNLYPPFVLGGAELSASFLAAELTKRGHAVSVITITDSDSTTNERGIRIHRIKSTPFYSPLVSKKKPGWMKPAWHFADLYNPLMGSRVRKALEEERPDVLHCHNIAGFSSSAWEAAGSIGIPIVQHFHDYHLVCIKATLMNGKLEQCPNPHFPCNIRARYHFEMLARNVRRIISPSRFCSKKVFEFDRGENRPWSVSIIPNGTEYAEMPPPERQWLGGRLNVLYLGGLFEHKGFPIFKEIVEKLNDEGRDAFEFNIGGSGPLEAMARDLEKRYSNVRFHGFVGGETKLRLFREAHMFLFPSIWLENNPVSIIEALAMGLPVLGSEIGGVPELLAPISNSLLFPPGSVSSIIDRLHFFERERGRLKAISKILLDKRPEYSMESQVDKTLDVYDAAIAEGGRDR